MLYSPHTSINGAKLLLNKGPPRKANIEDMSDALAAPTIITPHALPMFRDGEIARGTKRKREKDRMDPRKSKRPELPVTGPGRGGRVGASATQHVVQNLVRDTTRDEDVSTVSYRCRGVHLHPRPFTSSPSEAHLFASRRDDGEVSSLGLAAVFAVPSRRRANLGYQGGRVRGWRLPPRHAEIMRWLPQSSHVCSLLVLDHY